MCNALPPTPQLSLDLFYTEDEIYELSYAREPRCPRSLVSADALPLSSSPSPGTD